MKQNDVTTSSSTLSNFWHFWDIFNMMDLKFWMATREAKTLHSSNSNGFLKLISIFSNFLNFSNILWIINCGGWNVMIQSYSLLCQNFRKWKHNILKKNKFSNSSNVFNSRAVYETVKYRTCYLNDWEFPVAYFIKTVKKNTLRQKVKWFFCIIFKFFKFFKFLRYLRNDDSRFRDIEEDDHNDHIRRIKRLSNNFQHFGFWLMNYIRCFFYFSIKKKSKKENITSCEEKQWKQLQNI